jgi:hypothetical protein
MPNKKDVGQNFTFEIDSSVKNMIKDSFNLYGASDEFDSNVK